MWCGGGAPAVTAAADGWCPAAAAAASMPAGAAAPGWAIVIMEEGGEGASCSSSHPESGGNKRAKDYFWVAVCMTFPVVLSPSLSLRNAHLCTKGPVHDADRDNLPVPTAEEGRPHSKLGETGRPREERNDRQTDIRFSPY